MKRYLLKLGNLLIVFIVIFLVLVALGMTSLRYGSGYFKQHPEKFAKLLSQIFHHPIQVDKFSINWSAMNPEIVCNGLSLLDPTQKDVILSLGQAIIRIDLLNSLLKRRLVANFLELSNSELTINFNQNNKYGLAFSQKLTPKSRQALNSLLSYSHVYLPHLKLNIRTPEKIIHLPILTLDWHPYHGKYQLVVLTDNNKNDPLNATFIANVANLHTPLSKMNVDLYMEVNHANLANYQSFISFLSKNHLYARQGKINVIAWANIKQGKLPVLKSQLQVDDLIVQINDNKTNYHLPYFSGFLNWQNLSDGWLLQGHDASFTPLQKKHTAFFVTHYSKLNPHFFIKNKEILDSELNRLILSNTWLPASLRKFVNKTHPKGKLENFEINITNEQEYQLKTDFKEFALDAWKKMPGIDHLQGRIFLSPTKGKGTFTADGSHLNYPYLFTHSIPITKMRGEFVWTRSDQNEKLSIPHLAVTLPNAIFDAQVNLKKTNHSKLYLSLLTHSVIHPIKNLEQLLPNKFLPLGLTHWISHALPQGNKIDTTITYEGTLSDFPWHHPENNLFLVKSHFYDVDFNYSSRWPLIKNANADLSIQGKSLSLKSNHNKTFANHIVNFEGRISDLNHPELLLNANIEGETNHGLEFIKHSPLHHKFKRFIENTHLQGNYRMQLQGNMPLTGHIHHLKTKGIISLEHVNVDFLRWRIMVTGLTGNLIFNAGSIKTNNLTGFYLGQPLKLSLNLKPDLTSINIDVNGKMSAEALQRHFKSPMLSYCHGSTDYNANFVIGGNNHANNQTQIQLSTNLEGMKVDLPFPLSKPIHGEKPLILHAKFTDKGDLPVYFRYGNTLTGRLQYFFKNHQWQLTHANLYFGDDQVVLDNKKGLTVGGHVTRANWSEWHSFLKKWRHQHIKDDINSQIQFLQNVNLLIGRLDIFGATFWRTHLQIKPVGENLQLSLNASDVVGDLLIQKKTNQIKGEFKYLNLQTTTSDHSKRSKINPLELPAINFHCEELLYNERNFGAIRLITHPDDNGLVIQQLAAKTPDYTLVADGKWEVKNGHDQTRLTGRIDMSNLGNLLANWQMTHDLAEGSGTFIFDLDWPGRPFDPRLDILYGQLKMDFRYGRIINIGERAESELGLGKLITILNLESLPRRLNLNFTDLTDSGFSFDVLRGNFLLEDGIAYTKNALFDGPVAEISFKGKIDLAEKQFDLHVLVTPYLTSSLPIVATIAGGPLAGAVTWAANKVFDKAIDSLLAHRYHVKGPWKHPAFLAVSTYERNS